MKYREFIVVAKGGHETQMVKAPRAVTMTYARKNVWRWARLTDEGSEVEDDYDGYWYDLRPMCPDECAFVMPWTRGKETYRRESDGQLVCCYLPIMDVVSAIERGESTLDTMCEHDPYMRANREFYADICAQLESDGYIVNTDNGYKFNP